MRQRHQRPAHTGVDPQRDRPRRRQLRLAQLQQQTGQGLAEQRVADDHRHNVAVARAYRQATPLKALFQLGGVHLLCLALAAAVLEMPHAGQRAGRENRRQRCGENEAWGMRSNGIDAWRRGGDVAAHHAESLGKRSLDHVDAVGDLVAFRDATAMSAVHAHGMHLVKIGQCAIPLGEIANGR